MGIHSNHGLLLVCINTFILWVQCVPNCNITIPVPTYSRAEVRSPSLPSHFTGPVVCNYNISMQRDERTKLVISFDYLNFGPVDVCSQHRITFYDGPSQDHPTIISLCKTIEAAQSPKPTYWSSNNSIFIQLKTSNWVDSVKFLIYVEKGHHYWDAHRDWQINWDYRIRSPNYPWNYPHKVSYVRGLTNYRGYQLILQFNHFDLEASDGCKKDSLKIYDGSISNETLKETRCGRNQSQLYASRGKKIVLVFTSDSDVSKIGFDILAIPCGKDFGYNHLHVIESPGYPNACPTGMSCPYVIKARNGLTVRMVTNFFFSDQRLCKDNNVTFYDGIVSKQTLITTKCGNDWTDVFSTKDTLLFIVNVQSMASQLKFNFTAETCSLLRTDDTGYLMSPRYPSKNNGEYFFCTYAVRFRGPGKVKLVFEDFDIHNLDTIIIYDGLNSSAPVLKVFSGIGNHSDLMASGGSILLQYRKYISGESKFKLRYSNYNDACDLNEKDSRWQRSVGNRPRYGAFMDYCDENIKPSWYRFLSKAGGDMPTTCPPINSCGTTGAIWARGRFPTNVEENSTVQACLRDQRSCCSMSWDITVRKCFKNGETYHVFKLKKPPYCPMAYCAGTEKPCDRGWNSPNGFTPGCRKNLPKILSRPKLSPTTKGGKLAFKCEFDSDSFESSARYDVTWFEGSPLRKINQTDVLQGYERVAYLQNPSVLGTDALFKLGVQIFCRIVTWHANQDYGIIKGPSYESNHYYAGVQALKSQYVISEATKPLKITFKVTVPIVCQTRGCNLTIVFTQNNNDVYLSSCSVVFLPGHANQTQDLEIISIRDFFNDGDQTVIVTPKIINSEDLRDFAEHTSLSQITIKSLDIPTGRCASTGDPHFITFDKMLFDLYQVGDYLLVKSVKREFEVHARQCRCGSVACNCGVVAREGGDVIMLDSSIAGTLRVEYLSKTNPQSGTSLRRSPCGKYYKMRFPSGAVVSINVYYWHPNIFLDLYIDIPSDDYQGTHGLCGTFDSNIENELVNVNGAYVAPVGWRIPNGKSLFYYKETVQNRINTTKRYCNCASTTLGELRVQCNHDTPANIPGYGTDRNWIELVSPSAYKHSDGKYISLQHSTTTPYVFEPEEITDPEPKWPTISGRTKAAAEAHCNNALRNSDVGKVCSRISNVNISSFVEKCVEDIKLTDTLHFTIPTLQAMQSACEVVITRNKSFWVPDSIIKGTMHPPSDFGNTLCPSFCSGHGTCINATCICNANYTASDCSIDRSTPPTVTSIPTDGLCDIRENSQCNFVKVLGRGYMDSDKLSCRATIFQATSSGFLVGDEILALPGKLVSPFEVLCQFQNVAVKVTGDPFRQQQTAYVGYFIEVSNDGIIFSKENATYTMYDSKCVECNAIQKTCKTKKSTCNVNGFCFHAGEIPYGYSNYVCNPHLNATSFTRENSPEILAAPLVEPGIHNNQLKFDCKFQSNAYSNNAYFEVSWYDGFGRLNHADILKGRQRISTIHNLNADIFRLGTIIFCRVQSWYDEKQDPIIKGQPRESNRYYAGLQLQPLQNPYHVSEAGNAIILKFIATVPVVCKSSASCKVLVSLHQSRSDIILSTNVLDFGNGVAFQSRDIKVAAKRDFIKDGDQTVYVKIKIDGGDAIDWNMHHNISQLTIIAIDVTKDTVRGNGNTGDGNAGGSAIGSGNIGDKSTRNEVICHSMGDPRLLTFDNLYFSHLKVGDYVLVKTSNGTFEVHARTCKCSQVSCNCGVAAIEGDQHIIIDVSDGELTTWLKTDVNATCRGSLKRDKSGKTFMITFPSGAMVEMRVFSTFANIMVSIPSEYYGKTSGLCGKADGLASNDMQDKNGRQYVHNSGGQAPTEFTESWRLSRSESLFYKKDMTTREKHWICSFMNQEPHSENTTRIVERPGSATLEKDMVEIFSEYPYGNHTDINGKFVVLPNDESSLREYNPDQLQVKNQTWPTKSGRTKEEVETYCNSALIESAAGKAAVTLPGFSIKPYWQQCVDDMQTSDTDVYSEPAIESLKVTVREIVRTERKFYIDPHTCGYLRLPPVIEKILCPNSCSGHGTCVNSTCICESNYESVDCSIKKTEPPSIRSDKRNMSCDFRTKTHCNAVKVIGRHFIDSDKLACRATKLKITNAGSTVTNEKLLLSGKLVSQNEVLCQFEKLPTQLEGDPVKEKGTSYIGYLIEVTNDGVIFSKDNVTYLMYDSKCIECDARLKTCKIKKSTCNVNGFCFRADEKPKDYQKLVCNPLLSQVNLTQVPLDECDLHEKDFRWQRSVGNKITFGAYMDYCDEDIKPSWYRFSTKAGGDMPTTCPPINSCGTTGSIWARGKFPTKAGENATIQACLRDQRSCCSMSWDITVRKCVKSGKAYHVYKLKKPPFCPMAYCAGTEVPCKRGWHSPNGYTPGCIKNLPKILSKPRLSPTTKEGNLAFKCEFDSDSVESSARYNITWFEGPLSRKINQHNVLEGDERVAFLQNPSSLGVDPLFKLGVEIYCRIVTWHVNQPQRSTKGPSYESNHYYAGIKFQEFKSHYVIGEATKPLKLTLRLTVPIACKTKGCNVSVVFSQSNNDVYLSTFSIVFPAGRANQTQDLEIISVRDFINDGDQAVIITPTILHSEDLRDFAKHTTLPQISLTSLDTPAGHCSSTGDPHFITFDKMYFDLYQVGDYLLVKSIKRQFEVHARQCRCGLVACNCGVVAREGNDVIMVDSSIVGTLQVAYLSKSKPQIGTSLRRNPGGRQYKMTFPSGAVVTVNTYGGPQNIFLNLYIDIPSDYYNSTYGLCGTLDSNIRNELMDINGKYVAPVEWRIPTGKSLFYYEETVENQSNASTKYCKSRTDGKLGATCDVASPAIIPRYGSDEDWVQLVPDTKDQGIIIRDRITCLLRYISTKPHVFEPEEITDSEPTWPTKSGRTKVAAEAHCNKVLRNSDIGKVCSKISKVNISSFIEKCVEDIKLTDTLDFTKPTLQAMQSECEVVITRNISLWVKDPIIKGKMHLPTDFGNTLCPNFCSGHGNCINATCICNGNFTASDCSIDKNTPPTVTSIPPDGLCDIRKNSKCNLVKVLGRGYMDSDKLSCRATMFQETSSGLLVGDQILVLSGKLVSPFEVLCQFHNISLQLKGDPLRQQQTAYVGYFIEVSNDGIIFSKENATYMMYDSKCVECNAIQKTCKTKKRSCNVNGFCFHAGEIPKEYPTLVCNPHLNATSLTKENSPKLLSAPVVEPGIQNNQLKFDCKFQSNVDADIARFEVTWYDGFGNLNHTDLLKGRQRRSTIHNINSNVFRLGTIIYCRVQSWYDENQNPVIKGQPRESNRYYAGLKVQPIQNPYHVSEAGKAMTLKIISTVPVICKSIASCKVSVSLIQSSSDIILSTNVFYFGEGAAFQSRDIKVAARRDFIKDGDQTVSVKIKIDGGDALDWNMHHNMSQLTIIAIDVDKVGGDGNTGGGSTGGGSTGGGSTGGGNNGGDNTGGRNTRSVVICHSMGDPRILTFDKLYFSHLKIGDYVLVKAANGAFEVHARTCKCSQVSCNCGVAAIEGDQHMVIDVSNGELTTWLKTDVNATCRGSLKRDKIGKTFMMKFPSGAVVEIQIFSTFANIMVLLPSEYYGKTTGLCGTSDGLDSNDMQDKNGNVYTPPSSGQAPAEFTESWRLSRSDSLFYKQELATREKHWICNFNNEDQHNRNKQPIAERPGSGTLEKDMVEIFAEWPNGKIDGKVVVVPNDESSLKEYNPDQIQPEKPTWPTKSGRTKEIVEAYCNNVLIESSAGEAAMTIPGFSIKPYWQQCVDDIQTSDRDVYSKPAVEALKVTVREIVRREPTYYPHPALHGELDLPTIIEKILCPNSCSGHGTCVNSTCICSSNYDSVDCSIKKTEPPLIRSDKKNMSCDVRTKAHCNIVKVLGGNFMDSEKLACRATKLQVSSLGSIVTNENLLLPGKLVSQNEVLCQFEKLPVQLEGDPVKGKGTSYIGYLIEVTNDGVIFSKDNVTYLMYDSKCIECDAKMKMCKVKKNTCYVNGFCFHAMEKPKDYPNLVCNPLLSQVALTDVPLDECDLHEKDFRWQRSIGNKLTFGAYMDYCDTDLKPSWYRFSTKAGEDMPTTCPPINSCGTSGPIWARGAYPKNVGETTTVKACLRDHRSCCSMSWDINVRKCVKGGNTYNVYKLKKPPYCPMAYCAGTEIPCDKGWQSANGFTPGCIKNLPKILSGPNLSPITKDGKLTFKCEFDSDTFESTARYEVTWYEGQFSRKINQTDVLKGDERVAYLQNPTDRRTNALFKLGVQIFCRVVTWHEGQHIDDKKRPSFHSNHYFAGIQSLKSQYVISEATKPLKITLRITVPIICQAKGCNVTIVFTQNNNDVYFSSCSVVFVPGPANKNQDIEIIAVRDFVADGDQTIIITPNIIHSDDLRDFDEHTTLPQIMIKSRDIPTGFCASTGDPHFISFDRARYDLYQVGDYLLVKSFKRDFEVHARQCRCGHVACNCGVVAKEGNDVIMLDSSKAGIMRVAYLSKSTPRSGTSLTRSPSGNYYKMRFPSGAVVTIHIPYFGYPNIFLDLYIYVPSDDYNSTHGLCGTFDSNSRNELLNKDGDYVSPVNWRIPNGKSLFYYNEIVQNPDNTTKRYCTCASTVFGELRARCDHVSPAHSPGYGTDKNWVELVSPFAYKHSNGKYVVLPLENDVINDIFEPEEITDPEPTWPTKSGRTKAVAEVHCNNALRNSDVGKFCTKIPNFNISSFIEKCVEDIKLTDSLDFIISALQSMRSACEDAITKNTSLWKKDPVINGKLHLPTDFGKTLCPNFCSLHGTCNDTICSCDGNYTANDCSFRVNTPPTVMFIPPDGLCDIQKSHQCNLVKVLGRDYMDSDKLSCRANMFKISSSGSIAVKQTLLLPGKLVSPFEVLCQFDKIPVQKEGDAVKQQGTAYIGYLIEVSNDGVIYSKNNVTYIVHNSNCTECNNIRRTCRIKKNTCNINGFCFNAGEIPIGYPDLVCNPHINQTSFTKENSPKLLADPVVYPGIQSSQLKFDCKFESNIYADNAYFEVTWYDDYGRLNHTDLLRGSQRISTIHNINKNIFRLGTNIHCRVQSWYDEQQDPIIKGQSRASKKYYAGFKVVPYKNPYYVSEAGKPLQIKINATVPVVCKTIKSCKVLVRLHPSDSDVVLSTNILDFGEWSADQFREFKIVAKRDFVIDGNKKVNVTIKVERSDAVDWNRHHKMSPLNIITIDADKRKDKDGGGDNDGGGNVDDVGGVVSKFPPPKSKGTCQSNGDPRIITFDNLYFSHLKVGDHVLVKTTNGTFEVHARTCKCSRDVSCNCGLAAIEGDQHMIIDNSEGELKIKLKTDMDSECGASLKRDKSGRTFVMSFPSGAKAEIKLFSSFANIMVSIPSEYYGTTSGLCGTSDDIDTNDMQDRNGKIYPSKGHAPAEFTESWKLGKSNSLFYEKETVKREKHWICDFINEKPQNKNRSRVVDRPSFRSVDKDMVEIFSEEPKKKRTDGDGPFIVLPSDNGESSEKEYNPGQTNPPTPKWPTESGRTKDKVEEHCSRTLIDSEAGKAAKRIPGFSIKPFWKQCVDDMQTSDTDQFTESSINALQASVQEAVLQDLTFWKANSSKNGALEPPKDFDKILCPNLCSGHGTCVNATCLCESNYASVDCSVKKNEPPTIRPDKKNVPCDLRKKAHCSVVKVTGGNFIDSEKLACRATKLKITSSGYTSTNDSSMHPATLVSFSEVLCNISGLSLQNSGSGGKAGSKASKAAFSGYSIEVTNDGINFAKKTLPFLAYDTKCIECNATSGSCKTKASTCNIDGVCYNSGETSASDSCAKCDPSLSQRLFSKDSACASKSNKLVIIISSTIGALLCISITAALIKFFKHQKNKKSLVVPDVVPGVNTKFENAAFEPQELQMTEF